MFNTVILYYKIGFLILNITALEARVNLRELALVWIECVLLRSHGAEFIVQLGTVIVWLLKLSIGITVDAHAWVNIDVDILRNVLNGIVVDCVRSLLLLGVVLLLLLIVEVILVTHVSDVWVKLIHEWISLHGKRFHHRLRRKLVNLNLF